MHSLFAKMTISCREATRLASEARERRLSARELVALFAHTLICATCRRWGPQVAAMEAAFHAYEQSLTAGVPARIRLPEDARRRIALALREAAK